MAHSSDADLGIVSQPISSLPSGAICHQQCSPGQKRTSRGEHRVGIPAFHRIRDQHDRVDRPSLLLTSANVEHDRSQWADDMCRETENQI